MYALARAVHQGFAAAGSLPARRRREPTQSIGEYGRFFDGPPPAVLATAWQINGGVALMQAAAALDPSGRPADPRFWAKA